MNKFKKFNVVYSFPEWRNGKYQDKFNSIEFEVVDLDHCKNAVNQWRVNRLRQHKETIEIISITEIK